MFVKDLLLQNMFIENKYHSISGHVVNDGDNSQVCERLKPVVIYHLDCRNYTHSPLKAGVLSPLACTYLREADITQGISGARKVRRFW